MNEKEALRSSEVYSLDNPLIQVEHLTHIITSHVQNTVILNDITFSVPRGSLFAITGPSGSGKSTILNMLTGVDRPTSGRILFAGEELRGKSENTLARWRGQHVGIIFQFFQLIPTLTSLENVLLALELGKGGGLPRQRWRIRAMECLDLVGLKGYERRLPSELSGGQQQRVAIARALANNPPVLIADEPTGNLDSKTADAVFAILVSLLSQDKTIIYVTHDKELAEKSTARINLIDGQIVEQENARAVVATL